MTIYIYTRVSSLSQAGKGQDEKTDSIENQIKRCKGWLMANNYDDESAKVIEEKAVSGSLPLSERPEGGAMLKGLQEGDVVICYKLDRLFRNLRDSVNVSEDLRERKVSLVLMDAGGNVTYDALGQMYFALLSLFAQFERTKIADRTREGAINRREEGGFTGGPPPFGWVSVRDPNSPKRKILVKDETEQKMIKELLEYRAKGSSYQEISEYFEYKHNVKKHPSTWMRIYETEMIKLDQKPKGH